MHDVTPSGSSRSAAMAYPENGCGIDGRPITWRSNLLPHIAYAMLTFARGCDNSDATPATEDRPVTGSL